MSDAVLIAVAATVSVAGVAFGVGCLLWARREVARARDEAGRTQRQPASSGLERTLRGGGRAVKAALQTAARVREQGLGGIFSSLEELAGWAEAERPDLRRMAARDGTVTILFSDIENSTATNERLGDQAWVRLLGVHDSIVRGRVEAHGGFVVKAQGDGFMVAFSEPGDAVDCAVEIQRKLTNGDRRLRKQPIQVRIGIHIGTAVERNGDLFGRNVALAARVAAAGSGGQILVSESVAEKIEDLELAPADEVELKGLGAHRLYEVEWKQPA